ncbi:MAG: hypothetical protein QM765_28795 [Myxococcales bacterium]
MTRHLVGSLACVAALTAIGCAATYYDPYYYDDAYYDPYYYSYDAAYAYTWYDPYGVYYYGTLDQSQTAPAGDLNAAAAAIAQRAQNYYSPSGCVTATASGTTVTYTFNNCVGPFQTRPISGTVNLTLSQPTSGGLTFKGTSTNLTIDGKPFILDVTATGTSSGTQRTVTLNSHSRLTDRTDSRDTQGTLTWTQGSDCFALNGKGTSTRKLGDGHHDHQQLPALRRALPDGRDRHRRSPQRQLHRLPRRLELVDGEGARRQRKELRPPVPVSLAAADGLAACVLRPAGFGSP